MCLASGQCSYHQQNVIIAYAYLIVLFHSLSF